VIFRERLLHQGEALTGPNRCGARPGGERAPRHADGFEFRLGVDAPRRRPREELCEVLEHLVNGVMGSRRRSGTPRRWRRAPTLRSPPSGAVASVVVAVIARLLRFGDDGCSKRNSTRSRGTRRGTRRKPVATGRELRVRVAHVVHLGRGHREHARRARGMQRSPPLQCATRW